MEVIRVHTMSTHEEHERVIHGPVFFLPLYHGNPSII